MNNKKWYHEFVPLNLIQWLTLVTAVTTAVLVVIIVHQGRTQRQQADSGLRTFICFFEKAALHPNHQAPPTGDQKKYIVHFFNNVLDKINEPRCSSS